MGLDDLLGDFNISRLAENTIMASAVLMSAFAVTADTAYKKGYLPSSSIMEIEPELVRNWELSYNLVKDNPDIFVPALAAAAFANVVIHYLYQGYKRVESLYRPKIWPRIFGPLERRISSWYSSMEKRVDD